jgi:iron complex outermembrane recepter protein
MRMRKLIGVTSLVKQFTITVLACVCIAAIEMPAMAQQAPAIAAAPEVTLQEVIVTGSRIPVPANISATSPISVVTSQDIALSGHTDTTDIISMLPQNVIGTGVDFGNTSSPLTATGGIATADLRGMGPQRTLVLVDGRRLGAGDPSTTNPNPAPDLDQIPAIMVDRVEVVTGGASATYGSDAVAGVVNFIMKKNFEGVEVSGQYGFDMHHQGNAAIQADETAAGITPPTGSIRDGDKRDLSILMGTNIADGMGNITGYFVFQNLDPIQGRSRDFADCDADTNNRVTGAAVPTGYICNASENSNIFVAKAGGGNAYSVVGNQFLPYPQAGSSPPPLFNFPAYQFLQRQDERYQAGFMAHLDLNDAVKPYLDFSFMNDRSEAVVGPSGLFGGGNPLTSDGNELINCSNPLLSAQEAGIICTPAQIAGDKANPGSAGNSGDVEIGRRNIEGGGRVQTYEHTNFRVVGGLNGTLGGAWNYDAYFSYYYTSSFADNLNYLNYASINNALQVTTAKGQPVCISGGTCVPYNIFTTGAVTPAQLTYLYSPGTSFGTNEEEIGHADVAGDLGKYGIQSPWAKDGVGIDIGVESRVDKLNFAPDAAELQGDLAGFSGASAPVTVSENIKEEFVEARAPIAQNAPGVYDLTVDAGARLSDYSVTGRTTTYKFEVQYAPTPDVRFRSSYDRAVRAPNLVELFNPKSYGQYPNSLTDPCAPTNNGATGATASLAACLRTAGSDPNFAAQYGNGLGASAGGTNTIIQCISQQCGQVVGGNPNLKPEIAETFSFGLSLTPTALPNFSGSIDYYHIKLAGAVGTIPPGVILQQCLATGNPTYCDLIVRTPNGSLTGATVAGGGYFLQNAINTGSIFTSGVDVQMNYRYSLPDGWGRLQANLTGAYVQHNESTIYSGASTFDCAGLFGNTCGGTIGTVNPRWRHNLRVTWDTPWNLLFSAQWRFIGGSSFDNNSSQKLLQNQEEPAYDPLNAQIPNVSYLDLTATWKFLPGMELRAGVNNVFDKDPPFVPSDDISSASGNVNSYPTYDLLGRELFIGFTAKF